MRRTALVVCIIIAASLVASGQRRRLGLPRPDRTQPTATQPPTTQPDNASTPAAKMMQTTRNVLLMRVLRS
jgi:hypothetical protein